MNDSLKFLDNFRYSILNMWLFVFLNDKMFYLYDLWRFTNAYNIIYNCEENAYDEINKLWMWCKIL